MAGLWEILRQEVHATVDELREKGAVGALRDAALDTCDMAADTSGRLFHGVREIICNGGPVLRAAEMPMQSTVGKVEYADGRVIEGLIVGVDDPISETPKVDLRCWGSDEVVRARVVAPNFGFSGAVLNAQLMPTVGSTLPIELANNRMVLARILAVDENSNPPYAKVALSNTDYEPVLPVILAVPGTIGAANQLEVVEDTWQYDGIMANPIVDACWQEWRNTMEEFREKGAVGAVKDAALDVVDIVGNTAKSAYNGAKSIAANATPLVDVEQAAGEEQPKIPVAAKFATEKPLTDKADAEKAAVEKSAVDQAAANVAATEMAMADEKHGADKVATENATADTVEAQAKLATLPVSKSTAASIGLPRKSLVAMRRSMFEKPREQAKPTPTEEEELID